MEALAVRSAWTRHEIPDEGALALRKSASDTARSAAEEQAVAAEHQLARFFPTSPLREEALSAFGDIVLSDPGRAHYLWQLLEARAARKGRRVWSSEEIREGLDALDFWQATRPWETLTSPDLALFIRRITARHIPARDFPAVVEALQSPDFNTAYRSLRPTRQVRRFTPEVSQDHVDEALIEPLHALGLHHSLFEPLYRAGEGRLLIAFRLHDEHWAERLKAAGLLPLRVPLLLWMQIAAAPDRLTITELQTFVRPSPSLAKDDPETAAFLRSLTARGLDFVLAHAGAIAERIGVPWGPQGAVHLWSTGRILTATAMPSDVGAAWRVYTLLPLSRGMELVRELRDSGGATYEWRMQPVAGADRALHASS